MGHLTLPVATNKYDPMYEKCTFELVEEPRYNSCRRFIHSDLAEKLMKTLKTLNINALRRGLEFNVVDVFSTKQSITETIKEIFKGENIQTEYEAPGLHYEIDIYFH